MTVATVLWIFSKKIILLEAIGITVVGFIVAVIFHMTATAGMGADIETWSGRVTDAIHHNSWLEYYEYAVYRTEYYTVSVSDYDSKGRRSGSHIETRSRQVFDHWQSTTRQHSDYWDATDTLIDTYEIDQGRFEDIHQKFGSLAAFPGIRRTGEHNSHMIGGNPNDFRAVNIKNYIYPVVQTKKWTNKILCCPTVFSFGPIPETAKVTPYPDNYSHFSSGRLVGATGTLSLEKWDIMNAAMNPQKKVNVIAAGFGPDSDEQVAEFQQAKWIGGKKNDLVIAFGGGKSMNKPSWVKVFGWTDGDLVKQELQTLILDKGISNEIIPDIQAEIIKDYTIKDWHKFDYLEIEIPFNRWMWFFGIMIVTTIASVITSFYLDLSKTQALAFSNSFRGRRVSGSGHFIS